MSTLIKLTCICGRVDMCISPKFLVVTGAFLAHLCLGHVSHNFSLFASLGVEILERLASPCSGGSGQCWKGSMGRQLFKESHSDPMFGALWLWELVVGTPRTGVQKVLTQRVSECLLSRSSLHFLSLHL